MDKTLAEDMEFARRTEEALRRIEKGQGTKMHADDFLQELDNW